MTWYKKINTNERLRWLAVAVCVVAGIGAVIGGSIAGPRVQAGFGVICFIAIVAACSPQLQAVNWRTVWFGLALQIGLALFVLKFEIFGVRPGYLIFEGLANVVRHFLEFTNAGSRFVFGGLADPDVMSSVFPGGLVLAFTALPPIIFVSSFFTLLYHFGILQVVVRLMARAMMFLLHTSGAETLSATANVFMGQTEAPLMVKPYVANMTRSELLALMTGGLATISGGMMAVYIGIGADPVAILTTSVMAAPCGLYLSKILLPETETPETGGRTTFDVNRSHTNAIDAIASGASDGVRLVINVAAMLIAFLAFIEMINYLLGLIDADLSLSRIFSLVFAPVAFLIGIPIAEVPAVADLLGTKLVANEFVAYLKLTSDYKEVLSERSFILVTFALTGFANFGSVGIQLGGIGGIAPERRGDLARLGWWALLAGFFSTMINASLASILL